MTLKVISFENKAVKLVTVNDVAEKMSQKIQFDINMTKIMFLKR